MTNASQRSVAIEAIVCGGSAGSFDVVSSILAILPADFSLPIVVVIHIPAKTPSPLAEVLGAKCRLAVKEAEDKEPLIGGTVYVGAPNYHLLVERDRTLSLSVDPPLHFSRPSIDVLFESAADAMGPTIAGVLLTGANDDGAVGLARIHALGGLTVVQSPETAAVRTMPDAAIHVSKPDFVLDAWDIGPFLARLDRPPFAPAPRGRS